MLTGFRESSETRFGSGRGDDGPAPGDESWPLLRAGEKPFEPRDECGEWKEPLPMVWPSSVVEAVGGGRCLSFRKNNAAVVVLGLSTPPGGENSVGLCSGEGGHEGLGDIARGAGGWRGDWLAANGGLDDAGNCWPVGVVGVPPPARKRRTPFMDGSCPLG